jgi:hypothetical protein
MEKSMAPGRSGDPSRARRCGRTGRAKEKTRWGGPRKPLIRLDSDKEIQAFPLVRFGRASLNLAQFGPILIPLGFSLDTLHIGAHRPHPEFADGGADPLRTKAPAAGDWNEVPSSAALNGGWDGSASSTLLCAGRSQADGRGLGPACRGKQSHDGGKDVGHNHRRTSGVVADISPCNPSRSG